MSRDCKVGSGLGWDGGPRSKFQRLREAAQAPLLLPIEPVYDPAYHPYDIVEVQSQDGSWQQLAMPIRIYLDVRADIAAGLRNERGEWIGKERGYGKAKAA